MKNRLPKEGWYVKSTPSVVMYINRNYGKMYTANTDAYYGVSIKGEVILEFNKGNIHSRAKELTIEQFEELSKPIEPPTTNAHDDRGKYPSVEDIEALYNCLHKEKVCAMLEDLTNKFESYHVDSRVRILTEFLDSHNLPYVDENKKAFEGLQDLVDKYIHTRPYNYTLEDTGDFTRMIPKEDYEGAWSNKQVSELLDEFKHENCSFEDGTYSFDENSISSFLKDNNLIQEEPKLEVGKVYKDINYPKLLLMYTTEGTRYGFDLNGKWVCDYFSIESALAILNNGTPNDVATPEEWKTALTKEAEKRGLVENETILVDSTPINSTWNDRQSINTFDYHFDYDRNSFHLGGISIMRGGVWAYIVQEETTDDSSESVNVIAPVSKEVIFSMDIDFFHDKDKCDALRDLTTNSPLDYNDSLILLNESQNIHRDVPLLKSLSSAGYSLKRLLPLIKCWNCD